VIIDSSGSLSPLQTVDKDTYKASFFFGHLLSIRECIVGETPCGKPRGILARF
jgi:hypothetical protein